MASERLKYPDDLATQNVPYMIFHAIDWKVFGKNRSSTAKVKKIPRSAIILPMPTNGLTDSQSVKWEEAEGLLLGQGFNAFVKRFANTIKDTAGDFLKGAEFVRGVTINDYASSHFEGSDFREFTFEFSMIPKTDAEAKTIVSIIKSFKRNSLPTLTNIKKIGLLSTVGLKYPPYWEIEINFPSPARSRMSDIVKFKELVITNVTCNYFPDNITTVFESGQPIKIDLSVSVKELEKMYATDYE